MTQEQAQKILDEFIGVRPGELKGEAKRLFEAIMKVADKRDELKKKVQEQDKIIDLMSEKLEGLLVLTDDNYLMLKNKEEVKQYFENKAKES